LPPAPLDQAGAFELRSDVRNAWSLDPQHSGEQVLRNLEHITVSAVTHHEQPARQALLETVGTVACLSLPKIPSELALACRSGNLLFGCLMFCRSSASCSR
jgi:hypothetical protein